LSLHVASRPPAREVPDDDADHRDQVQLSGQHLEHGECMPEGLGA
jgi:hypothetical protein